MNKYEQVPTKEFIFGSLFVIANRLDTLLERELKAFDITSKQWFLSIIVGNTFGMPPTIKEAAKEMGCSHQNVKQVALKLEDKGLLNIEKDEKDKRVNRINLTEKSDKLWSSIAPKGDKFMSKIFEDINKRDMELVRSALLKITENIEKLDKEKI